MIVTSTYLGASYSSLERVLSIYYETIIRNNNAWYNREGEQIEHVVNYDGGPINYNHLFMTTDEYLKYRLLDEYIN